MKFSVNWLGEFVDLPESVDELADLLTFAGIEIEAIERRGADFDNVVVAQISESKQHPNADRLSVCLVDDGSGKARQIVCGARNYKAGDKVPLALPGAILSGGLKIKASKLRGVESEGMLCSAKELALAEDGDGLLILAPESKVGAPIGEVFPGDIIFDVEITPNRPDLLSYLGLAREIAALLKTPLRSPLDELRMPPVIADPGTVSISALRECPFFSARRITGVTVGPSPAWLRTKLEASGIRSISNIVDMTNFVMLELGQPLHIFDADKLQGGIHVRLAREGEEFLALDGRTYRLTKGDLMIADQARAVGIAGVMGGEETGVTEASSNLLLEAAYFLPSAIRRTARRLNLPSDASYRFERGVDPQLTLSASARAAQLMAELAGGKAGDEVIAGGTILADPGPVRLRYERCNRLLGVSVEPATADEILTGLGLNKIEGVEGASEWQIPSFRRDLQREADLIEEVVRVHGIDKIPASDRSRFTSLSEADRIYNFEYSLRQRLTAQGVFEARTSALVSRLSVDAVEVRNPLSEDHVALRPDLTRGLLDAVGHNVAMGATTIRLFEIGIVFHPPDAREERALGLVFAGDTLSNPHWRATEKRKLDLFDLKGAIDSLRPGQLSYRRASGRGYALAADVLLGDQPIGFIAQLPTTQATELGAHGPVLIAELNIEALGSSHGAAKIFAGLDRFPAVARDVAMFAAPAVSHDDVLRVIGMENEPLLYRVELFDLFTKDDSPRKSMAYTLTYRHQNRTLTSEEVTAAHAKVRERLQSELGVELRE